MNYTLSMPAYTGDVVTQGHADYCAANGHATLRGESPWCHRCGATVPRVTLAKSTPVFAKTGCAYPSMIPVFGDSADDEAQGTHQMWGALTNNRLDALSVYFIFCTDYATEQKYAA